MELRKDGWFDKFRDACEYPTAKQTYLARQTLKEALEVLNRQNWDRKSLVKEIEKIDGPDPFKKKLYVKDDNVFVPTGCLYDAVLGVIRD